MVDNIWADNGLGGPLHSEEHYDGRKMLCFSERPATLGAMFDDLMRRFSERPAIVEDCSISYGQLDRLVGRIGAGLTELGVISGDRVALFLGNCWEFLASLLACNRIGAIIVPIGTRQRQAELTFLLADSGAKVLIFESELAGAVPPRKELPDLAHLFSVRGAASGARPFSDLLATTRDAPRAAAVGEEDIAVILHTSGTTGRPKGV